MTYTTITSAAILLISLVAWAEPPTPEAIKQLVADYSAKRPTQSVRAGLTLDEARHVQREFVKHLSSKLGKRIGYKAGLVSKAAQESVGASAPVRGVLLADMMLQDKAEVPANFGARPIYEPDLIVVVKDAGLNDARTPLEVARHLSEVVAFIELPDRTVAEGQKMDGNLVTAINAGARLGVLGSRVKIQPTADFVKAMENMVITATDSNGAELAKSEGKALMGNPLNAVLWLIKDLSETGETLAAGDLLSLGTFSAPKPPPAGQTVTVRYEGLPGGPINASVKFGK